MILILTIGKIDKMEGFKVASKKLGIEVDLATFGQVSFKLTKDSSGEVFVKGTPLSKYNIIYFRYVGRALEIATVVAKNANDNRIKIVDSIYEKSLLTPLSQSKLVELIKLKQAGIPIPKTVFGDFPRLKFPFVVKCTTGQKSREVWLIKNNEELEDLQNKFIPGKFYFGQELIPNAHRIRVLVVGSKAIGAIVRYTKWYRDETKETLLPIPKDIAKLAIDTSKAADLDICGVDILQDVVSKKLYVIEANAAPVWKLINNYCSVIVEEEILKFLNKHSKNK